MRFPLSQSLSMGSYILRSRIAGKKRFPLVLMLEPLHRCNLTCEGCGRIREYSDSLDWMMSVDDCIRAAEDSGAPIISICGGEPLIYPEIGELVRRLIGINRYIYLCTNGLLLKNKLGEFTPSNHLMFNVHLDGQETTHDAIVGREGVFKAAFDGIIAAKSKGFRVSTNTTVYRETDMSDIESLLERLSKAKVDTYMISPGYDYESVRNGEIFVGREDVIKKFSDIDRLAERFPLSNTPIYLEFLKGERKLPCSAWGSPTVNPIGWRSPCYLLADKHYPSFKKLMEETDWDAYGPDKDERCADCMMHSGFEPSVVLGPGKRLRDLLRLAVWQMS